MIQDFPERTDGDPAATHNAMEPFGSGSGSELAAKPGGDLAAAAGSQVYVPVAAMEAMLKIRHDQIFRFGHTLEADRAMSLSEFAKHLRRACTTCCEDLQFHVQADIAQRHITKLGALCMAIYDRLEAEKARGE